MHVLRAMLVPTCDCGLRYWQQTSRIPLQLLTHSRRISNSQKGMYFESVTVRSLQKYSFDVTRCGGPRDRGVDFRGVWRLGSSVVTVFGQCKLYKRRLGPVCLRELEGALSHEHENTLALLVTSVGFTRDAYQHFMGSTYPIALAVLEDIDEPGWSASTTHDNIINNRSHQSSCNHTITQIPEKLEMGKPLMHSKDLGSRRDKMGNKSTRNYIFDEKKNRSSSIRELQGHKMNKSYATLSEKVQFLGEESLGEGKQQEFMTCVENDNQYVGEVLAGDNNEIKSSKWHHDTIHYKNSSLCDDSCHHDQTVAESHSEDHSCGRLTLFELNVPARILIPGVVTGRTISKGNSRSLELVLFENNVCSQLLS